jgi:hypothetical protein
MLMNQGDLTFVDTTEASGTAGRQNTFHSTFVDLNNDGDLDLVLAQNTGEIEIFAGKGDGTFDPVATQSGYGFWMGIGVGDIDQDGDQDLFVSNIGTSIPNFLTSGDLMEDQRHNTAWSLLRNDGDFQFTETVSETGLDGYGFAWGGVFQDLNQDGEIDLLVAQNYIKWPVHQIAPLDGKALLHLDATEGRAFYAVDGLGLENPHFGQSPLTGDLNGDGRPDVAWLNMDGPFHAYLNQGTSDYLTLRFPDASRAQGARVELRGTDGTILRRQIVASEGLMTDSSSDVFFGLGAGVDIESVDIQLRDGTEFTLDAPTSNEVVTVTLP